MSIQRILIPIKPEQTIDHAMQEILSLANQVKATVKCFSVVDDLAPARVANHLRLSPWALLEMAQKKQLEELNTKIADISSDYPNVKFETAVTSGMPFLKIIEEADQESFDLIAISSKTETGKGQQFGSTTRHLMRKSAVPVWAVSNNSNQHINRIVAAVDLEAPSEEGVLLNEQIVIVAAGFARLLNAELTLVHAWKLAGEGYLRTWGDTRISKSDKSRQISNVLVTSH